MSLLEEIVEKTVIALAVVFLTLTTYYTGKLLVMVSQAIWRLL